MNIISLLTNVKKCGENQYRCTCPAHGSDKNQSLMVWEHQEKIGFHCFAGCNIDEICSSIGIEVKDIYEEVDIDSENVRLIVSEKRAREAKESDAHKLYMALTVLKQCIEGRLFSSDTHPANKTECWDAEKQSIRQLPSLMVKYYGS